MSVESSESESRSVALAPAVNSSSDLSFKPLQRGWDGQLRFEFEDEPKDSIDLRSDEPPIRVMALHALLYCERLFFLEEVEEIRVADGAVYAGRRLHDDILPEDDESPERRAVELASERWGLQGKADAVRRRDGVWVAYEHKRGRCARDANNRPMAWPSDRIQVIAYAVLLEEALGETIPEGRVRYHADNVTAFVPIDDAARDDLRRAILRAREIRRSVQRPPVTHNERLCVRCSLNVVCLPEEERLQSKQHPETQSQPASDTEVEATDSANSVVSAKPETPRFFPSNRERQTLHVVSPKAYIGRSGDTLVVTVEDQKQKVPINSIDALVIHGFGQVTTQAIHMCAYHNVAIEWLTAGGRFSAGTTAHSGRVQQRLRQYEALRKPEFCLELTRRLVRAKVETQLRYILRSTRGTVIARERCAPHIERMRLSLSRTKDAGSLDSLRGLEGMAAKSYFACLPHVLSSSVDSELHPKGRSKHPPEDRFNAALSFGYSLLRTLVHRRISSVGLEPAFGFFHQPRSAAHPLVLDMMELFRTWIWEIPLIGSVNRGQWEVDNHFEVRPGHVWLSESGRKLCLELFEQRLTESHKHPFTGQSLTFDRMVELEVRLLEKEWTGCPGLFAQLRLR